MDTPICDFLHNYAKGDSARLHMPGHKGRLSGVLGAVAPFDITEITGADVLFCADGIIEQSEANTASLYGAQHTCFSTQGSTTCIMAMLRLVASDGDCVIAARNVHHSFINGCALLGIEPEFVYPKSCLDGFTTALVTPDQINFALKKSPKAKAVYITSPDYLGIMSDIKGIADVCSRYSVPLLVDNAHGAYLPQNFHPITNGATLCCDSAHKTLPVLTGGAYLHTAIGADFSKADVKTAMALFSSTSPSYLTLMSLDSANVHLESSREVDFAKLCEQINPLREMAAEKGYLPMQGQIEPAKLTLMLGGTTDHKAISDALKRFNIEPEYFSDEALVLMFSAHSTKQDYAAISGFLESIPHSEKTDIQQDELIIPNKLMTIRSAVLSAHTTVSLEMAEGRVVGEIKLVCPPGVPILIPGEIIDAKLQKFLKKSSIFDLIVIK